MHLPLQALIISRTFCWISGVIWKGSRLYLNHRLQSQYLLRPHLSASFTLRELRERRRFLTQEKLQYITSIFFLGQNYRQVSQEKRIPESIYSVFIVYFSLEFGVADDGLQDTTEIFSARYCG